METVCLKLKVQFRSQDNCSQVEKPEKSIALISINVVISAKAKQIGIRRLNNIEQHDKTSQLGRQNLLGVLASPNMLLSVSGQTWNNGDFSSACQHLLAASFLRERALRPTAPQRGEFIKANVRHNMSDRGIRSGKLYKKSAQIEIQSYDVFGN